MAKKNSDGLKKAGRRALDTAREAVQRAALSGGRTESRTITIEEDGETRQFKVSPRTNMKRAETQMGQKPKADVKRLK